MPGEVKRLSIDLLRLDFQPEENVDPETVEMYDLRLQRGERLSPVRVYFDGEEYWLNDGFHRIAATRRAKLADIDAEIVLGTYEEMQTEWEHFLAALKKNLAGEEVIAKLAQGQE